MPALVLAAAPADLEGPGVVRLPPESRLPVIDADSRVVQGTPQGDGSCLFQVTSQLSGRSSWMRQDLAFDPATCRKLVEEGVPDALALALMSGAPGLPALPPTSAPQIAAGSCSGPRSQHTANLLSQWVDAYDETAEIVYSALPLSPAAATTTTVDFSWTPTESCALGCPGSTTYSTDAQPNAGWGRDYGTPGAIRTGSSSCWSGVGVKFSTRYRNGTDNSPTYNCAPRDLLVPEVAQIVGRAGSQGNATFTDSTYVSGAYEGCGQHMFHRLITQVDTQPLGDVPPVAP